MTGLRGALTVRVNDGQTDRHVTRYCRGLRFTKTAPGGHRNLAFSMTVPRDTFSLGPQDRCYVYDARTARTVAEGYMENPTPIDGPDGQQYDISAMGGMALANDESRALIYLDKTFEPWQRDVNAYSGSGLETVNNALHIQVNPGMTINTNQYAGASNTELQRAGMNLGAVRYVLTSGKIDTGYKNVLWTSGSGFATIGDTLPRITTTPITDTWWVSTHFAASDSFSLLLQRIGGATNVADDLIWSRFSELAVLGQRMDRNGALLTGATGLVSATQVLASQVVEDLLGRLLTFCDAGTATIDATTFGITQLAYPDGVKAAGVLNDLAVFEPDFIWEILESLDNGKHRFSYRAWPTTPRYEVSVKDGWRQTGSDADLCNRILVSWSDAAGNPQVTTVTAASLGLTGIGLPVDELGTRVKDADSVSLPDGRGSSANATRIGGQILTDKIKPPKAGTVLVRRPIVDHLTGSAVMPWEIEPGYLCRVRETGDDLRITQVDYNDDDTSMLLTLGTPVLTQDQRLARLDRVVPTVMAGV